MINIGIYEPVYIDGIRTIYYVSEFGDVISYKNEKIKHLKVFETKPRKNKKKKRNKKKQGYLYVKLWIDGKTKAAFLHRLVAQAYIPNPDNKPEVNHKNANKHDNYVNNLEWVTSKENKTHARKHKLTDYVKGEDMGRAKYKNSEIEYACQLLSENKYTVSKISEMCKVDVDTLYNIRSKGIYYEISSKYTFPSKTVESNSQYTTEDIENVCKLRQDGYTAKKISEITGVKIGTVNDVIHRRRRRDISNKYNFIS